MTDDPTDLGAKARGRRAADLAGLQQRNGERLARLVQQGLRVDLTGALVNHLIAAVFPDVDDRMDFVRSWEESVAKMLDEVESQAARARLLAGVQQPPNGGRAG